MKKIPVLAALIVMICAFGFFQAAAAASGHVKGSVELVRTHDAEQHPAWAPPRFWFTLKGVTQAGSCPRWANNNIMFAMNDKQALAIILAAQHAGQEVAVSFDDTQLYVGWCAAGYITTGNPPPLY